MSSPFIESRAARTSRPLSKGLKLFLKKLLPRLPRRLAGGPEVFEQLAVAERVHALPEARVLVRHQLPVAGQLLHGLFFPLGGVAVDVVEDGRLEDEEGAVDPALAGLRLLAELGDAVAL